MSRNVSEDITSPFAETESSIAEAVSASLNPPLYSDLFSNIVVEEDAATKIAPDCLRAGSESIDEGELVDLVGRVPTRVRSGDDLEGFNILDSLNRAN